MKLSKTNGGLGFKDLELFNLAMLAKQGWRLLHYPNSLALRVLSAKYYPEGNFLEAKVKRTSSFIWRSVMAVRSVLESGLMWRIGNGSKAQIWQDKWLPSSSSFKIQSQCLDNENKKWKKLWKLPITNAEKLFLWKACQDILPTKCNLVKKRIPDPTTKINWDASVRKEDYTIGVGIAIRDWQGKFMATMRMKKTMFPYAHLAESFVTLQAVILAVGIVINQIILEGDALQVVNDLLRDKEN
ncbi:hypothetical protein Patl1_23480 [Pistacia atlantica]|uniref:Uncharacterized protein n=1 Tax=Pistacia atlantica TaxID=434234 RepID=A0ACC0ZU51_9ROSI|nr:hypothetical protein Patl1_23480 [Pistacia atlantica]